MDDTNRLILTTLWNTSLAKANQYFGVEEEPPSNQELSLAMAKHKRLVEQGVEPNPGPNASRRNQEFDFQICTLNTQGVPGPWRALEHYGDKAKVLLFQDTPFTENEFVAFQRAAKRKHYRTYWQPGKVHPSGRRTGGMVPSSLSQQPIAPRQDLPADVYLMIIHIHDYAVLNFYASPGCGKDMAELLTATFISHKLGGYPWVAAGDANEEPNHHIAASFTQCEGHVFSSGLATRFEGKEELDWFSTSRPSKSQTTNWLRWEFKQALRPQHVSDTQSILGGKNRPFSRRNNGSHFCKWHGKRTQSSLLLIYFICTRRTLM